MQNLGIGLMILSITLAFTTIGFETAYAEEIKLKMVVVLQSKVVR